MLRTHLNFVCSFHSPMITELAILKMTHKKKFQIINNITVTQI